MGTRNKDRPTDAGGGYLYWIFVLDGYYARRTAPRRLGERMAKENFIQKTKNGSGVRSGLPKRRCDGRTNGTTTGWPTDTKTDRYRFDNGDDFDRLQHAIIPEGTGKPSRFSSETDPNDSGNGTTERHRSTQTTRLHGRHRHTAVAVRTFVGRRGEARAPRGRCRSQSSS